MRERATRTLRVVAGVLRLRPTKRGTPVEPGDLDAGSKRA
jgi:hypothetical protein